MQVTSKSAAPIGRISFQQPPVTVDLSKAKGGIDSGMGSYVEAPWQRDGKSVRVRWAPDWGNGSLMKFEGGAWKFLAPEELKALKTALQNTPNGPASADAREFYSAVMKAAKPF